MRNSTIILVFLLAFSSFSCKKEDPFDYDIKYQDGFPNEYTGNWKAYDISITSNYLIPLDFHPYDLVIALDPDDQESLIIDNIYDSKLRLRVKIDEIKERFAVVKGEQLENSPVRKITAISMVGYHSGLNDYYYVAPDLLAILGLNGDDEGLTILIELYDEYNNLYDRVITKAIRKTGFEDLDEQL